jgi:pilus assembly protein CpaF
LQDGTRRVTQVSEVVGLEGDTVTMQDLFVFRFAGQLDDRGRVLGRLSATGLRPLFLERLADRNVQLDQRIFAPPVGEEPW